MGNEFLQFRVFIGCLLWGSSASLVYISTFGIVDRKRKFNIAQRKHIQHQALGQALEDSRQPRNIKFITRISRYSVQVNAAPVAYFQLVLQSPKNFRG